MAVRVNGDFATWVTSSAAARMLEISVTTLAAMVDRGELGCLETKLGRLYDPAEVQQLAVARTQGRRGD